MLLTQCFFFLFPLVIVHFVYDLRNNDSLMKMPDASDTWTLLGF